MVRDNKKPFRKCSIKGCDEATRKPNTLCLKHRKEENKKTLVKS